MSVMESDQTKTEDGTAEAEHVPESEPVVANTEPVKEVEPDNTLLMGILAYVGILIIIPYLVARDNTFVKYHVQQGLVLCIGWIILWVVGMYFWAFYPVISLVQLGLLVLSIIGIVNVVQKKQVPLPLVGSLAKNIKM